MPEIDANHWMKFLENHPEAHLLQTTPWGDLKAGFGWEPVRVATTPSRSTQAGSGAQILFRKLPLGFSIAYIPKGPLFSRSGDLTSQWDCLLPEIDAACKKRRAIFLKVEPDRWEAAGETVEPPPGFSQSEHAIQPNRTLVVDLTGDDQSVMARMKQKTRYNIKLALKKGVVIHPSADMNTFHKLMQTTSQRDGFGVHSLKYYQRAYDLFHPRGACELFMADFQGEPLAAVMVFIHGKRAWYFYGASASDHRERMPNYLLQWEAMRWARLRGCLQYDLWGVPDEDETTLENQFLNRADGLWGVYRFKRGFGGHLCRSVGPWDRVYFPLLYNAYRRWIH
jgi:peptidoglycan pentaglycine glycine transferase (the first glycine)